jgi:hypothetical protein
VEQNLNTGRLLVWLFGLTALGLVPWTLWLTYSLPARHLTHHYDIAWIGFDIALAAALGLTAWALVHGTTLFVPLAAGSAAMLLCDAWFDVITSWGGSDLAEAVLEASFAELPLAAICAFVALRWR